MTSQQPPKAPQITPAKALFWGAIVLHVIVASTALYLFIDEGPTRRFVGFVAAFFVTGFWIIWTRDHDQNARSAWLFERGTKRSSPQMSDFTDWTGDKL